MITYNLQKNDSSDTFYLTLRKFSSELLDYIKPETQELLQNYTKFISGKNEEKLRSTEEYIIEILTLGMFLWRYNGASQNTSSVLVQIMRLLYKLRTGNSHLKRLIDPVRGLISGAFLVPKIQISTTFNVNDPNSLKKLILWLEAAGEFNDEVKRIKNWEKFLQSLTHSMVVSYLEIIQKVFIEFKSRAHNVLGAYTDGVRSFLNNQYQSYRFREDELFCGKSEVEYHLNMVGSEVINWGFKNEFLSMKKRTVLLPGCMQAQGDRCAANHNGLDITCIGCTPNCNIHRITKLGENFNFSVFIIPHTSSFTKWLKRFQNTEEYGVVAVACLLNIVVGGYQMRELNIPSQCVLLDYCGCKKHWHPKGIVTVLNEHRLLKVLFEAA